jgi:hypothetical protein
MKWPWKRNKQLIRAQREQDEVKRRGRRREELAQKAEQHLRDDPFGQAFRQALGGR